MQRSVAGIASAAFFVAGPGFVAGFVPWRISGWQFDVVMGCAFLAYLPLVPFVSRWARVLWMYVDWNFDPEK